MRNDRDVTLTRWTQSPAGVIRALSAVAFIVLWGCGSPHQPPGKSEVGEARILSAGVDCGGGQCRWGNYEDSPRYYVVKVKNYSCSQITLSHPTPVVSGVLPVTVSLSGSPGGGSAVKYKRKILDSTLEYDTLEIAVEGTNIGAEQEPDSLSDWWNGLGTNRCPD